MARFFDYESAAKEAGIPAEALEALRQLVRKDYARDDMLFELRMLRTCHAIREGVVTVGQVLSEGLAGPAQTAQPSGAASA